jgi:hypothetical protein
VASGIVTAPAPMASGPAPPRVTDAPGDTAALATPTEEIVAGIWATVLGRDGFGRDADFFGAGGHSLAATRVVSRVRAVMDVEVPVRDVFEHRRLAAFAARVDARRAVAGARETPPLRPSRRGDNARLSFAQEGVWRAWKRAPNDPVFNVTNAVGITGALDVAAFLASVREIVRRHDVLRSTFVPAPGGTIQRALPLDAMPLPDRPVDLRGESDPIGIARRLAMKAAATPFSLGAEAPLRVALYRLADETHVFVLVMHHIVTDGWSVRLVARELATLYHAFSTGDGSPLEEPRLQYSDFARWQRRWLRGDALARRLAYWSGHLRGGISALPRLPYDRPNVADAPAVVARQALTISPELARGLTTVARERGVTLFMTVLAAVDVLLHQWTGQCDLDVGTPFAGRSHPDTETLLGCFAQAGELRTNLTGDPSWLELLDRVRSVCQEAYANQDVPSYLIVDAAGLRDAPPMPVYVRFEEAESLPSLTGLTVEPFALPTSGLRNEDLIVGFVRRHDGLRGALEYRANRFEPATMERVAAHLETLLHVLVADPRCRLSRLPELGSRARVRA